MKKIFAVVTLASLVGSGILAIACSDDGGSTFDTSSKDAGKESSTTIFGQDGDTTNVDAGIPVDCKPQLPASFVATFNPGAHTSSCSDQDISDYLDACNPDPGASTCLTFVAAHEACATCIEKPADNSGPFWIGKTGDTRKFFVLNVGGCYGLATGNDGNDSCASLSYQSLDCQKQSCASCFNQAGAQFDNFQACEKASVSNDGGAGGCVGYESARLGPKCTGVKADAGADCAPTAEEAMTLSQGTDEQRAAVFKAFYTRAIKLFCGNQ